MKNFKILYPLLFIFLLTISCSKESMINTNEENSNGESLHFKYTLGEGPFVHFEDMGFKEVLLNNFDINKNKDDQISLEEASAYRGTIDVHFKNIQSLAGIEKFENINALDCANNNLHTLDLSNNINLEVLRCGNNPFNEINLSFNKKLTHLDIRTTEISTLDLSQNPNLIDIRGMCNFHLKTVNIRNNNNAKILVFFFELKNPNLECVQVDDVNYSRTATNWMIDINAHYSLNCFDS